MNYYRFFSPILAGTLLIFTATPLRSAQADDDEIHRRAQCAQVELAIALGDAVSPGEKAACEGRRPNKPAALVRPRVSAAERANGEVPPLLQGIKPSSRPAATAKAHAQRPAWVDRIPRSGKILYGVGVGESLTTGFQRAVVVIAAQLQVSINAETTIGASSSSEDNYVDGAKVASKGKERQYISESAQMMVKGALDDIRIEDQFTEPDGGRVHVLATLDLQAMRAKEENLLKSVLSIMSRASERFVQHMQQDRVIHLEALFELISVLDEVNALGRSKLGKKVRKLWRRDYRKFKRLVEKAVQCGDVAAKLHRTNGKVVPADSQPAVHKGDKLRGVFSCRGFPIVNARVYVTVDGGITALPDVIQTDEKGRFALSFGTLYGQDNVVLGFRHSLRNIGGAYWFGDISRTKGGNLRLRATTQPTMTLKISGLDKRDAQKLYDSLSAFATRKWGAVIKKSGDAQLKGTARIDLGNIQETGEHYAQSATLLLTVQSQGNTLFDRNLRKGALGESRRDATEKSLNNLMQAIQRW